ncbi:hypothetical protein CsatA_026313 [Cannabis sativa]
MLLVKMAIWIEAHRLIPYGRVSTEPESAQKNIAAFRNEVASNCGIRSRDMWDIESCHRVEAKSFSCTSNDVRELRNVRFLEECDVIANNTIYFGSCFFKHFWLVQHF